MPAYVIVDVRVRDRESYERYKQLAAAAVILEFPTAEQGRAW